ncbi:hypothetical protein QZH41_011440 [Actinostola sp. cb2023]|nr:hypothetical protein QZH41_011440 [Actinostola sp. cb2023]
MAASRSVQEVCEFLKRRDVEEEVISTFEREKCYTSVLYLSVKLYLSVIPQCNIQSCLFVPCLTTHMNNTEALFKNNDDPEDSDEITEVKQVTVKRSTILHDALELYCDPHIVECKLNVTFKGEQGIDFGGVTEDFFCSFWEAAFAEYFEGDVVKIPLATPIKMSAISNSILPALGRILEHGWRLTRKIPVRFCEASFIALVYGEEAVPNQVLKRSFLWYINQFERDILCSLLEGEKVADYKKDAIFGLYQRFSMQCLPAKTEEALKEHIITMARAEFVFKPMFFLSAMRRGIGEDNLKALQKELPIDKISELYDELSPTCETVLQKLKKGSEDLRLEEVRVFNFLTIYVGSMDSNLLRRFLHFVTGSTATPRKPGIKVCFNGAQGLSRVPCASTCSSTLTISTTYESFAEFKKEFNMVLGSDEAFEMNVP